MCTCRGMCTWVTARAYVLFPSVVVLCAVCCMRGLAPSSAVLCAVRVATLYRRRHHQHGAPRATRAKAKGFACVAWRLAGPCWVRVATLFRRRRHQHGAPQPQGEGLALTRTAITITHHHHRSLSSALEERLEFRRSRRAHGTSRIHGVSESKRDRGGQGHTILYWVERATEERFK